MTFAPSPLNPHGQGAHVIAREMWIEFGVGAFTFALVIGLLVWILIRRSRHDASDSAVADEKRPQRWIVLGGIVFPLVTLTALFSWSVHDLASLEAPAAAATETIQVIGHQWWWEVQYPVEGIKTADYVALPAGRPVEIRVRSADVIHSFWVPELGRKLDALPDEWNTMWLQSTDPGRYRGECAEFCGLQHAHMDFVVDVLPQASWARWTAAAVHPAAKPATPSQARGLSIFETHSCAYCHTIRGTGAQGWLGPDLTHLASRPSLAGAMLPNTRANLAAWITNPQHVKPGALMPRTPLARPQRDALLDYLDSLK